MNTREVQQQIRSLIDQLTALLEAISTKTETPEMVEAVRRNNVGLCCFCGEPHGDSVIYRGDHEKCHKKVKRLIYSKQITEEQAVRRGWWLPAEKGGRKFESSDPIAKYLAEKSNSPKARTKRP